MTFDIESTPASQIYNLLIGLVAPRPIAWVTSMDEQGRLNAAPFSSYNYLCTDPPVIGMGVTNRPGRARVPKDTAHNIRRTGEFVVNVVTEDLLQQMNICATDFPEGVNELEMAQLTTAPSSVVKVPRIAQAHAALEQNYVLASLDADYLSSHVDLIQALGGGYLAGPEAFAPRPEPETDQLTPLVDAIEALGGG